jgi:hypothetical protein
MNAALSIVKSAPSLQQTLFFHYVGQRREEIAMHNMSLLSSYILEYDLHDEIMINMFLKIHFLSLFFNKIVYHELNKWYR